MSNQHLTALDSTGMRSMGAWTVPLDRLPWLDQLEESLRDFEPESTFDGSPPRSIEQQFEQQSMAKKSAATADQRSWQSLHTAWGKRAQSVGDAAGPWQQQLQTAGRDEARMQLKVQYERGGGRDFVPSRNWFIYLRR